MLLRLRPLKINTNSSPSPLRISGYNIYYIVVRFVAAQTFFQQSVLSNIKFDNNDRHIVYSIYNTDVNLSYFTVRRGPTISESYKILLPNRCLNIE